MHNGNSFRVRTFGTKTTKDTATNHFAESGRIDVSSPREAGHILLSLAVLTTRFAAGDAVARLCHESECVKDSLPPVHFQGCSILYRGMYPRWDPLLQSWQEFSHERSASRESSRGQVDARALVSLLPAS
jgi:hypothetical protein